MKSARGQCLDLLTANSLKTNKFEYYTMDKYCAIVKYKTAYYFYFFPVCLAMRMVSIIILYHLYNNYVLLIFVIYYCYISDKYM